jgi:hypothetical protein
MAPTDQKDYTKNTYLRRNLNIKKLNFKKKIIEMIKPKLAGMIFLKEFEDVIVKTKEMTLFSFVKAEAVLVQAKNLANAAELSVKVAESKSKVCEDTSNYFCDLSEKLNVKHKNAENLWKKAVADKKAADELESEFNFFKEFGISYKNPNMSSESKKKEEAILAAEKVKKAKKEAKLEANISKKEENVKKLSEELLEMSEMTTKSMEEAKETKATVDAAKEAAKFARIAADNAKKALDLSEKNKKIANEKNNKLNHTRRIFNKDSKLLEYLQLKFPQNEEFATGETNLSNVLTALKEIISSEKLFDPQNPIIIICDANLEYGLGVIAIHFSELKFFVCKQLFHICNSSEYIDMPLHKNYEKFIGRVVDYQIGLRIREERLQNTEEVDDMDQMNLMNEFTTMFDFFQTHSFEDEEDELNSNAIDFIAIEIFKRIFKNIYYPKPSREENNNNVILPTRNNQPGGVAMNKPFMNIFFPVWASPNANAVRARIKFNAHLPLDAKCIVSPALLKVMYKLEGVDKNQKVFTYREVLDIVKKYIIINQDRFFDYRHIEVALVEKDIIGKAFGVKAFGRSQMPALIQTHLTLIK